ncbi:MAG TPA: GNAT family N-acetyltransferase [Casimicrobiaceae bacterium]|jgi:ribosomal protein S18 acetylase RimI-like enzyme
MAAIRHLVPTEASEYRALMLEAYERHPDAFTSSVSERAALPLSWWESRLASGDEPSEVVFGAFQNAELAGVAGLSFESRQKIRHKATLFGMYVPSRFRGLRLGRQLVVAALDCARARASIKVVQLTVTEGNASAQALYRGCGFVEFGVEPFAVAVASGYVSKVHMWCSVDPDVGRVRPGS